MKFNTILGGIEGLKEPLLLHYSELLIRLPLLMPRGRCGSPTFMSDISQDQPAFKLLGLSSGVIQLIYQRAIGSL